jgi:hypothetical protein
LEAAAAAAAAEEIMAADAVEAAGSRLCAATQRLASNYIAAGALAAADNEAGAVSEAWPVSVKSLNGRPLDYTYVNPMTGARHQRITYGRLTRVGTIDGTQSLSLPGLTVIATSNPPAGRAFDGAVSVAAPGAVAVELASDARMGAAGLGGTAGAAARPWEKTAEPRASMLKACIVQIDEIAMIAESMTSERKSHLGSAKYALYEEEHEVQVRLLARLMTAMEAQPLVEKAVYDAAGAVVSELAYDRIRFDLGTQGSHGHRDLVSQCTKYRNRFLHAPPWAQNAAAECRPDTRSVSPSVTPSVAAGHSRGGAAANKLRGGGAARRAAAAAILSGADLSPAPSAGPAMQHNRPSASKPSAREAAVDPAVVDTAASASPKAMSSDGDGGVDEQGDALDAIIADEERELQAALAASSLEAADRRAAADQSAATRALGETQRAMAAAMAAQKTSVTTLAARNRAADALSALSTDGLHDASVKARDERQKRRRCGRDLDAISNPRAAAAAAGDASQSASSDEAEADGGDRKRIKTRSTVAADSGSAAKPADKASAAVTKHFSAPPGGATKNAVHDTKPAGCATKNAVHDTKPAVAGTGRADGKTEAQRAEYGRLGGLDVAGVKSEVFALARMLEQASRAITLGGAAFFCAPSASVEDHIRSLKLGVLPNSRLYREISKIRARAGLPPVTPPPKITARSAAAMIPQNSTTTRTGNSAGTGTSAVGTGTSAVAVGGNGSAGIVITGNGQVHGLAATSSGDMTVTRNTSSSRIGVRRAQRVTARVQPAPMGRGKKGKGGSGMLWVPPNQRFRGGALAAHGNVTIDVTDDASDISDISDLSDKD